MAEDLVRRYFRLLFFVFSIECTCTWHGISDGHTIGQGMANQPQIAFCSSRRIGKETIFLPSFSVAKEIAASP